MKLKHSDSGIPNHTINSRCLSYKEKRKKWTSNCKCSPIFGSIFKWVKFPIIFSSLLSFALERLSRSIHIKGHFTDVFTAIKIFTLTHIEFNFILKEGKNAFISNWHCKNQRKKNIHLDNNCEKKPKVTNNLLLSIVNWGKLFFSLRTKSKDFYNAIYKIWRVT